jgi:hypothetical protein
MWGAVSSETLELVYQPPCCHNLEVIGAISSEALEPVYQPTYCHNLEVKGAFSSETLEPVYQPTYCHNLEVKGAVSSETLEPLYQSTCCNNLEDHNAVSKEVFWDVVLYSSVIFIVVSCVHVQQKLVRVKTEISVFVVIVCEIVTSGSFSKMN